MARALRVTRGEGAAVVAEIPDDEIGEGPVTIDVEWSSLNYKDALAVTGRPGVIRADRLIAGIDLVGTVRESADPAHAPGERVLVNGRGLGETHDGGLAEIARVPGDWPIAVPDRFTARQAAAIGTAGYTAALCVLALGGTTGTTYDGEILVTGATGGVGSLAIALLARGGHTVAAVTGKPAGQHDYLRGLGATTIIDRAELESAGKPLQSERWSGAIDTVGGPVLANVLAQTRYGGTVATCGMAGAPEVTASMMPFILRAVSLVGVNSVFTPTAARDAAWRLLDRDLDTDLLDGLTASIGLQDAVAAAERMLAGETTGRTVVDVRA
ncbi:MAG: MDR family oxidoreductase [Pseudolysinimonas sp.]